MKHHIIHILALSALLGSCNNQESNQQSLIEASRQELATALSERDELLALVKEIATATNQLKHLESIMTLTGSQSKENPSHSQILTDIAAIKQTLERRRKELSELEERLKKSSLFTDDLQATIEALCAQIDAQAEDIAHLQAQLSIANNRIWRLTDTVDSLNVTVAETNSELDASRNESIKLENELNTCYYAVATKGELKEHHIIESGFLRKTKLMDGDFDKNFFKTGDKRSLRMIMLSGKKVKVYTNHPSGSFEIVDVGEQKALKIKNQEEFWNLTDYLVVQVD